MNLENRSQGKPILAKFARLNSLLGEFSYSAANREKIKLMIDLGLEMTDKGPFVRLKRNWGGSLKSPRSGGTEIVADARADCVGRSSYATNRSMKTRCATRPGAFGSQGRRHRCGGGGKSSRATQLQRVDHSGYQCPLSHVTVIDSNDERGIDVDLLCREGYPIGMMRSHVDDETEDGEPIFSRDGPEYYVTTTKQKRVSEPSQEQGAW